MSNKIDIVVYTVVYAILAHILIGVQPKRMNSIEQHTRIEIERSMNSN